MVLLSKRYCWIFFKFSHRLRNYNLPPYRIEICGMGYKDLSKLATKPGFIDDKSGIILV
jgi:hypothetical protein